MEYIYFGTTNGGLIDNYDIAKIARIFSEKLDVLRLKLHKTHPGGTAHRDDFFQFSSALLAMVSTSIDLSQA